jgi:hypothetical protein
MRVQAVGNIAHAAVPFAWRGACGEEKERCEEGAAAAEEKEYWKAFGQKKRCASKRAVPLQRLFT